MWYLPFQAGDYNQMESIITAWSTAGVTQHQQQNKVNLPLQLPTVSEDAGWFLFFSNSTAQVSGSISGA